MDFTINISKLDKTIPEPTNLEIPYGLESHNNNKIKKNINIIN